MNTIGLIGKKLSHSFSKSYFTQKFLRLNMVDEYNFENFELSTIEELPQLITSTPSLIGFNVTNPYKEQIIPYIDHLNGEAREILSVNTVTINPITKTLSGYNTDCLGFKQSLTAWIPNLKGLSALILGNGGAAKAVKMVLTQLNIPYQIISRNSPPADFLYHEITAEMISKNLLIIHTTPLGTFPETDKKPEIPYHLITENHYCYDLVYNPQTTLFLSYCKAQRAKIKNGLEMLQLQADASWNIYTS